MLDDAQGGHMQSQRPEKTRELLVPIAFAILWGLFAIWLRNGGSIL